MKSAAENLDILKEKIAIEISEGRVAGPFVQKPFLNFHVSPLGLVARESPGQYRVIHHLSCPEGSSVNDGIPSESCIVHYQSIDDAVALIKQCGPQCLLSKVDISNAFRLVPIRPEDHELLGFCIDEEFYYDKVLPQGLSFSCALFETFSKALHWLAEKKLNIPGCAHVLDDSCLLATHLINKA